jgi:hypothetical protein
MVADTEGVTKTSLLRQVAAPVMLAEQSKNSPSITPPVSRNTRTASTRAKKSIAAPVASTASSAAPSNATSTVAATPMTCVGVINGLRNGQECY